MASFRALRHLNSYAADGDGDGVDGLVSSRSGLTRRTAERLAPGDNLHARIVRALGEARCVSIKEVVESFEVFEAVRKAIRSACVADLCCGHGLVGLLLAALERRVERVHLFDSAAPPNGHQSLAAVVQAAPWVEAKVTRHRGRLKGGTGAVRPTGIVATHACGPLTDQCLEAAVEHGCPVAVVPCCHSRSKCPAPPALMRAFGPRDAIDIDRTYRLERAGYTVTWRTIPEAITPMNRVLIGRPAVP